MKNKERKPDLLVFLSDQHTPFYSSPWGGPSDMPNLERIRKEGCSFEESYTTCPICVPARMSLLSGRLASQTGILSNSDTLPDMMPTYLHGLVAAGYETVLIGRMHFIGNDQRHGFTKRICGDITPTSFVRHEKRLAEERGIYANAFEVPGSVRVAGGGRSPVLDFDRYVIEAALDYLSCDYEKPQCIVVGTYAPHCPYVSEEGLFRKYYEKVTLPKQFGQENSVENPLLKARQQHITPEENRSIQAAYCGMIEQMDGYIGQIYDALNCFAARRGSRRLFCYLSDHGDQMGERDLYGKFTFFEKSVKIPMVFAGDGIPRGKEERQLTDIMDVFPTLCGYASVDVHMLQQGRNLLFAMEKQELDPERIVVSEVVETEGEEIVLGRMYRYRNFKYITYHRYESYDLLFDLETDPDETENVLTQHTELVEKLQAYGRTLQNPDKTEREFAAHRQAYQWFIRYEEATNTGVDERWKWRNPKEELQERI